MDNITKALYSNHINIIRNESEEIPNTLESYSPPKVAVAWILPSFPSTKPKHSVNDDPRR